MLLAYHGRPATVVADNNLVDLKQLRYFVKIADLGSISRAASVLFVAQPALSQQIASLERELDRQLLTRTARGVVLTASGKALYARATRMLRTADDIEAAVHLATDAPTGRVAIGIPVSVACLIAGPLVRAVADAHPHITLAFEELPSSYLPERLANGHLDLALMFEPDLVRGLSSTRLFEEDLVLVESAMSAAGIGDVPVAALSGRRLVLTPVQNSMRRLVDAACEREGVHYELLAEMSSPDRLIEVARDGLAATVMSWPALGAWRHDDRLAVRPIGPPRLSRTVLLCENPELGTGEAAAAVCALIPSVVKKLTAEAPAGLLRAC